MSDSQSLAKQWLHLVDQIAQLGPMHPGSICQQTNRTRTVDGQEKLCGPYTILTFKRNGKTVTRRLRTQEALEQTRGQIENFHCFQSLVAQLIQIGQQRSMIEPPECKKNSSRRSKTSSRPKPRG